MANVGLPSVSSNVAPDVRQFLDAVRVFIADSNSSTVTVQQLTAAGVVSVGAGGNLVAGNGTVGGSNVPVVDLTPPPAPTGLTATAALSHIMLQWDEPFYKNFAYAEVWRADVNDLGLAVLIGMAAGIFYTDAVLPGTGHYYWVRFQSKAGIAGPYNGISGTYALTGQDPASLLGVLAGAITSSQLSDVFIVDVGTFAVTAPATSIPAWVASTAYGVGKFVGITGDTAKMLVCKVAGTSGLIAPAISGAIGGMVVDGTVTWQIASRVPIAVLTTSQTINGATIAPGVYIDGASIVNGTIQNAQIANLAVDNAKIASLAVDKITAGSLAASSYIQSSNFVTGVSGFKLLANGSAEFSNITARGNIQATSFSQITLTTGQHIKQGQTAYNVGTGFFLGDNGSGTPVFSLGSSSSGMTWDGTALRIGVGSITGLSSVATTGVALEVNGGGTFTGTLSVKSSIGGPRMEITNNSIKVFDGVNTLPRVTIGLL